jgi:NAD(P)-dependent dehydrogenase (short-subunit alcohol dehydrogenase family)
MDMPAQGQAGRGQAGHGRAGARPTALVTGASRGIGKATAVALAAAGFDVAITARTVHEGEGFDDSDSAKRTVPGSLDTTAALVEEQGARSLSVPMDLLDRASLQGAVDRVVGEWGGIDTLVNNAIHTGPGSMLRFEDTTIEMIETKLAANVVSQVVLLKAVLGHMAERGSGTIVNVTSAVAITDPPAPPGEGGWGLAYAMSKGAFHRLAPNLTVEYPDLVFFNLEPGYVQTERALQNAADLGLEGRYPGAPPSVPAAVIAWLATSPDAGDLNGQTITAQKFAKEHELHDQWW